MDRPEKIWRCASYLRLSREDGAPGESESIAGQRALIDCFLAQRPQLRLTAEFVDDGWSGVRFDRPGLQALLDQVRAGAVDCVVVKDLSRFGRNYIETGRYLERIFPALGVRFLSVTEEYDSLACRRSGDGLLLAFRSLINDAYSRDLSVKARAQRSVRRQQGVYLGPCPLYGYIRDPACPQRLAPDPEAAATVALLFFWKLCGASEGAMARWLEHLGAPSPLEYHRLMGRSLDTPFQRRPRAAWCPQTVGRILREETYAGVLSQGRSYTPNYKLTRRLSRPPEAWSRTEHAHPPLVSPALFARVSQLLGRDTRAAPGRSALYLLSGLLRCPCGRWMVRRPVQSGGRRYVYWVCPVCAGVRRRESALLDLLGRVFALLFRLWSVSPPAPMTMPAGHWWEAQRAANRRRIGQYRQLDRRLAEDLAAGRLTAGGAEPIQSLNRRLAREAAEALDRLAAPSPPPWTAELPVLPLPGGGQLSRAGLALLLDRAEPAEGGGWVLRLRCRR